MMPSSQSTQGDAIQALQLHREQIHNRIAQLEAIIANPASGQVVISKARVELALLREHHQTKNSQLAVQRDLAEVKDASVASKLKNKLEYAVLKAKEDKARYELDVHHQLLLLRNKSLEEQNVAAQKTYNARQDALDAEIEEEKAQQALQAATRALEDAKSIRLQRNKNLEHLIVVQDKQDKEVKGLCEQINKNEKLIKQRLTAAGLTTKELNLIYENHEIGKTPSTGSGIGERLLSKAQQLNDLAASKKVSGGEKLNTSRDPPSPSSIISETATISLAGLDELFRKLDNHRSAQERQLQGLQSEVERLNTKCSKSEWKELLKLRSSNASLKDELDGTRQLLKLGQAKISTLEAETEDQKSQLRHLESDCQAKQTRINSLEQNNSSQRATILSLENETSKQKDRIQYLDARVHALGKDCIAKQTRILALERNNSSQGETILSLDRDISQQKDKIGLLEARVHALENESEIKQTKIRVLEQSNLSQREQIQSLENENLHQKNTVSFLNLQYRSVEEKITSLDSSLGEIKANIVHWHRLTSVMREELNIVQEKRELEDTNLLRLQRRLKHEETTLENTRKEALSLDKMKVLLEYRMMLAKEEEQKKQLQEMMADTVNLLEDKNRAVKALQSMKASYDTAISDKKEILFLHNLLIHVHETLMEWQNNMTSGIWAPSEILLACVKHESKADAVRKMQHMRLQTLLETKNLDRGSIGSCDPKIGTIISTGVPNPEDIDDLKRKLAKITAEKEEYRSRAKLEMYQISCRECNDSELHFIGKTRKEIRTKIDEHFEEIWAITQRGWDDSNGAFQESAVEEGKRPKNGNDFASTPLAFHFAKHCKDCETKEDALQICYKTIRVERRQRLKPKKPSHSTVMKIFGFGCEI